MRSMPKRFRFLAAAALLAASIAPSCAKRESALIPRETLFGNPVMSSPSISPDGKRIAYLAPAGGALNIHVATIGAEDDRLLTHETERGVRGYHWARDNEQILYVHDRTGMEDYHLYGVDVTSGEIRDYTPHDSLIVGVIALWNQNPNMALIQMNWENKLALDAYRLDLETGALALAAKNPGNVVRWFADTSFAVRGALTSDEGGGSTLLVRAGESDPWRELRRWSFEEGASSGPLRFTLDGESIYCVDATGADAGRLVSVSLADGSASVIAAHPRYDVSMVLLDPRTHGVQAVLFAGERGEWRVVDPRVEADIDALRRIDEGDFTLVSRDTADAVWIMRYTKDNGPVSYWAYDRRSRRGEFLFDDKPALRGYELARMEPVVIRARDGLELPGYLTYPPRGGRGKLPLVLLVREGIWSRDFWGMNPEVQWLANRGYACLQVNQRGSSGYGKEFANAGNREMGGAMQDDLVDAARWAIESGIADPARIGIFGASYGGFAVLSALADEPNLFRCGVERSGFMNLQRWLENPPLYWMPYRGELYRRVGDPVADAAVLAEWSPINKADRIVSALLLAHGGLDKASPAEEAERIVASLRSRSVPYEYLLFPDEGSALVAPRHRLEFYEAAERFLAEHLGGRSESRGGS